MQVTRKEFNEEVKELKNNLRTLGNEVRGELSSAALWTSELEEKINIINRKIFLLCEKLGIEEPNADF